MSLFEDNDKKGVSPVDDLIKGTLGIAQAFGKDRRTAQRWKKSHDFPKMLAGGFYSRSQIQAWLDEKDGKPPTASRGQLDQRQPFLNEPTETRGKEKEEARLKKITADIKELELRKLQGELISLAEIEALLAPRAMVYRQGILAMQTLAPEIGLQFSLPPETVRIIAALIERRAREVLENVLRALTLPGGQSIPWDKNPAQGGT